MHSPKLKDQLAYLNTSNYFIQRGEANSYFKYFELWLEKIHHHLLSESKYSFDARDLNIVIKDLNCIPLYFNEHNLKSFYTKRSDLLELFLKNNDCNIDYDFSTRSNTRKKIRVGILAAHYTPSAETFAYLPVYEYISREFEVILYSLQETGHPLEQYCQSCANYFRKLPKDLNNQVAIIRGDDLDLLFVSTNVTAVTNRICLLASHRLARVQTTSGASVTTTGLRHMDYFISGTLTDPAANAQEHYREKLLKLEGSAHCFSFGCETEKSNFTLTRSKLKIPDNCILFASGANFFKIIPELLHSWIKILSSVPNSRLLLLPYGPNWSNNYPKKQFENHIHQFFSKYGLSIDRLIILDPQPTPNRIELREYYKLADIYLDSFPFSGTTSLIEPLQVHLPVVTQQGETFRSAMGSAMIKSINIPELIAANEEDYIAIATELGLNASLRAERRQQVKTAMKDNPPFLDSRSYGEKMGKVFTQLFHEYQSKDLENRLQLKKQNFVIFPDWTESEETIGTELLNIFRHFSKHPENHEISILIESSYLSEEDTELFLGGIVMTLLMDEGIDVTEHPSITYIPELSVEDWKLLQPRIEGQIKLECSNNSKLAEEWNFKMINCPTT